MTSFKRCSHHINLKNDQAIGGSEMKEGHISGTVKCEIQSPIGNCNKMILNSGSFRQLQRVYEICSAELSCQGFLSGVCVDGENAACTNKFGGRNDAQADGSTPEDRYGRVPCKEHDIRQQDGKTLVRRTDVGLLDDCTPGCGDSTTKEANLVEFGRFIYGDHGDVSDHSVLGECGCTHLDDSKSVDQMKIKASCERTKWKMGFPSLENRLEPSGISPWPWVARTAMFYFRRVVWTGEDKRLPFPQRFVFPLLQNLHSRHSVCEDTNQSDERITVTIGYDLRCREG